MVLMIISNICLISILVILALLAVLSYSLGVSNRNERTDNFNLKLLNKQDIIQYNKQLKQILILSNIESTSHLELYNNEDKVVYSTQLEANQGQYNISLSYNFPNGRYRLEIKGGKKQLISEVIIG